MSTSREAKKIMKRLYAAYGTGSGYLFGIPPDKRNSVEAIVEIALNMGEELRLSSVKDDEDD